jgi:hypothetical protein
MVPSVSVAVADTAMLAGAAKVALLGGLLRLTAGGTLGGKLTVTLTALEIVMSPELSVALTVKPYVPTGTLSHVKV